MLLDELFQGDLQATFITSSLLKPACEISCSVSAQILRVASLRASLRRREIIVMFLEFKAMEDIMSSFVAGQAFKARMTAPVSIAIDDHLAPYVRIKQIRLQYHRC